MFSTGAGLSLYNLKGFHKNISLFALLDVGTLKLPCNTAALMSLYWDQPRCKYTVPQSNCFADLCSWMHFVRLNQKCLKWVPIYDENFKSPTWCTFGQDLSCPKRGYFYPPDKLLLSGPSCRGGEWSFQKHRFRKIVVKFLGSRSLDFCVDVSILESQIFKRFLATIDLGLSF